MSEIKVLQQEPPFAAFVGIDWADQKHVWCLQADGAAQRESGELEHKPEAVEAWVGQLCQRFANRPIAVVSFQALYPPCHSWSSFVQQFVLFFK